MPDMDEGDYFEALCKFLISDRLVDLRLPSGLPDQPAREAWRLDVLATSNHINEDLFADTWKHAVEVESAAYKTVTGIG